MNETQKQLSAVNDFSDVIKIAQDKVKEDIQVSSLAFYKYTVQAYDSSKKYGIIKVAPFPLQEGQPSYLVDAYYFSDTVFDDNEKLLLIYADRNFLTNLNYNTPIENKDKYLHQAGYAIAVQLARHEASDQIFTVASVSEMLALFGETGSTEKESFDVSTNIITYKGKEYVLVNGAQFLITDPAVADYWFSLDNMKLYRSNVSGYLPLVGGTMSATANISWADTGNWSKGNSGVTFPYDKGGLSWNEQSDSVKIFTRATASDNLDLIIKFGDDNSNGLQIQNNAGTKTAGITASGAASFSSVSASGSGSFSSVSASGAASFGSATVNGNDVLTSAGGIVNVNAVGVGSNGNATYNGTQLNAKELGIGYNGIAMGATDTKNDSAIIFVENVSSEKNKLVIATGDDSGVDQIAFRYYNTSGTAAYESVIPTKSGTIALTNDIVKNTAGATDTSSKIYLVGATEQSTNPQTYSDNEVYATSGVLTTKSVQVGGGNGTIQYNSSTGCIEIIC